MTIALILVVIASLSLVFMLRVAKGRSLAIRRNPDATHLRPIDLDAFRALMNGAETQYLQSMLSPADFRRVQRLRLQVAVRYIACAAQNAALLVRIGEGARRSADPAVAEAGEKLVNSAIQLRIYALRATLKLYFEMLYPGARASAEDIADGYERMTSLVFLLGRLQPSASSISGTAV